MSQRRAWGIEEQSATVGEESVLVMIIFPPVWVGECPEVSLQQEQIYPKVCHTVYDLPLSTDRKCGLSIALEG